MSEPTIYKPSIYKGTGIYKNGAEGGGGGGEEYQEIEILGTKYNCKEINGFLWMCENLRYPVGIFRGSMNKSGYYYPNGDYNNIEKYGYLLNTKAVKELVLQIGETETEWHVATRNNWNNLYQYIALSQTDRAGYYLKSSETWSSGTSIDILGFRAVAAGFASMTSVRESDKYNGFESSGPLWTGTSYGVDYQYYTKFDTSNTVSNSYNGLAVAYPVRLCKKLA